MQANKTVIVFTLLIISVLFGDSDSIQYHSKMFNGWDLFAVEIEPDNIPQSRFRIENYYVNGAVKFMDFFNNQSKFIRRHEFFYELSGNLVKVLVSDGNHKMKWYYYYDYDPLIMDWKVIKYSPKGEWLGAKYLREIDYDSSLIDSSYLYIIPIWIDSQNFGNRQFFR